MQTSDPGDHIGMESCVDMVPDTISLPSSRSVHRKPWEINSRRSLISGGKYRELPPPLPIESSTVMKRYYTDDGRLILTEEKIEGPKFQFTAVRSHGRLTIQLVNSDSELSCESLSQGRLNENKEENQVSDYECGSGAVVSDGDCENNGGGSCFNYNDVVRVAATGPCLVVKQNQIHVIRPDWPVI